MSEDIRKMIDKVKNFKRFINEGTVNNNPYIYNNPELVDAIEKSIEEDGSSFICTYVASAVKLLEGNNVKIYGFSSNENPESEYFFDDGSDDGHHFVVMDNRYIIDPWIYNNFEDYNINKNFNRSVFDLQNKNDEKIIKYLYGDRNKWTDITNKVEDFKDTFPNTYKELLEYYKTIQ